MTNEEDECDSSSLFNVASQSDVTEFLHAQAAKITGGFNSSISDDDENSTDGSSLERFLSNRSTLTKPYLSRSCFASISTSSAQKSNTFDDLTELKWLSTFKLKELKENQTHPQPTKENTVQLTTHTKDHMSKLSNELKIYDHEGMSISDGVCIFLALYSKRDDKQTSWSLTIEQLYEYVQLHIKHMIHKRGWKTSLKQTLNTIPCFVKTKHDSMKSRSVWTIDPYYRPLLTKAYLTSLSLQVTKSTSRNEKETSMNVNRSSESIRTDFPPKATVKSKALPRLYERLCVENSVKKDEDEADLLDHGKHLHRRSLGSKRSRSTSSSGNRQVTKDLDKNRLSSSSPWSTNTNKRNRIQNHHQSHYDVKTSTSNKGSTIVTPYPSTDHMYLEKSMIDEDDECDSHSMVKFSQKPIPVTRIQGESPVSITNDPVHRRKSSPPKKRPPLALPSRRANTRISRKVIEQDLQLLRQANIDHRPLDLSILPVNELLTVKQSIQTSTNDQSIITDTATTSTDGALDLSLTR